MNNYRFTLERSSKKFNCPSCGEKRFVRYIDTKTKEYLSEQYGKCDRQDNCTYWLDPYKDGYSKMILEQERGNDKGTCQPKQNIKPKSIPLSKPISFTDHETMKKSLTAYETNHFIKFLIDLFGEDVTSGLISKYYIGTSKYWDCATVFWQIDSIGKIRAGKIMQYSPITGKRVKKPFDCITWVHTTLKEPDYNLRQCLFGEHLLKGNSKPVAIVESEKTAIIASVYLPQFVWLATGGKDNFNAERCNVLRGRKVVLFPDLSKPKENKPSTFDKWSDRAKELSHITTFAVSDLLERKAPEEDRQQGFDLADYLIKFDYREFIQQSQTSPPPAEVAAPIIELEPDIEPQIDMLQYRD